MTCPECGAELADDRCLEEEQVAASVSTPGATYCCGGCLSVVGHDNGVGPALLKVPGRVATRAVERLRGAAGDRFFVYANAVLPEAD